VAMPDPCGNKANVKNNTQYDKQKWVYNMAFVCGFHSVACVPNLSIYF
jgi:hypothetical protein